FHPEPEVDEVRLEVAGQFLRAVDDVRDAAPPQTVPITGVSAITKEQVWQNFPHAPRPPRWWYYRASTFLSSPATRSASAFGCAARSWTCDVGVRSMSRLSSSGRL